MIFPIPPQTKVLHSYTPRTMRAVGGLQRSYRVSSTKVLQPYSHAGCRSVGGLFSGERQKQLFSRSQALTEAA